MRLRWLLVLAFAGAALASGGTVSGAGPECAASGPQICVDLVGDPATVPPSGDTPHYVKYVSHISNEGNQSATHTRADISLSGDLVLVSATSSVGTCSVSAHPTCTLGRL